MRILITILFLLIAGLSKAQVTSNIAIKLNGEKKYACKEEKKYNNYNSLAVESGCVFQGELKNCQPWNGKSYCYDVDELLDSICVYKNGLYAGNGVIEFETLINKDTINQKDQNNKKTGYWIITGNLSKEKGYADIAIVQEGNYKRSRKIGIWRRYWPNGNRKNEINYNNGRPYGKYISYFNNGNIEEKGEMKGGNLINDFWMYYSSGCMKQYKVFRDDSTLATFYFDDCDTSDSEKGTIELEIANSSNTYEHEFHTGGHHNQPLEFRPDYATDYAFGPKHNFCDTCTSLIVGDEDTKYIFTSPPKQDSINGYHKIYDKDGNILLDGKFKEGNIHSGKYYVYDEFGLLDHIEVYKEGRFAGNGVIGSKDKY